MSQIPGSDVFKNFMAQMTCLNHGHFGNRDDEFASLFAVSLLLIEDFLGKIPGQQQGVAWHFFQEPCGRNNWDVRSGCESALLVGASVGDKVECFISEPKKVKE